MLNRKLTIKQGALIASLSWSCLHALTVENTTDQGQDAWKITTQSATYFFQKEAGGFSSLLDKQGNDWIGFRPSTGGLQGQDSRYRGIPNLVHPGDVFHPGYTHVSSAITSQSSSEVVIESISKDDKWKTEWSIYETMATLKVLKRDPSRFYWFLYEGTPGGIFAHDEDWWMSVAQTTKKLCTHDHVGDLPGREWICFGDGAHDRVLLLVHHEDDEFDDKFYAMNGPQGGMTVFGFGRGNGTSKFLQDTPQHFSIAFVEQTDHTLISGAAQAILGGQTDVSRKPSGYLSTHRQTIPHILHRAALHAFLRRQVGSVRVISLRGETLVTYEKAVASRTFNTLVPGRYIIDTRWNHRVYTLIHHLP
ncbi:MAG: hypothetical protein GF398_00400 [Chitinivibrionales bacterium]|nr:hypothetical protein [Chitinivibrionales bacterium]